MPTDECIVDNYKKSKGEYPNSISFEREIEEAKKWVANENLKFAEKYPDQIPQPEQTGHYHIVRNLLFAVKKLTARAEQAERERDAAINEAIRAVFYDMSDGKPALLLGEGICRYCQSDRSRTNCASCFENGNFELRNDLRGQPQDGEGERCRVEF